MPASGPMMWTMPLVLAVHVEEAEKRKKKGWERRGRRGTGRWWRRV